MTGQSSDRAAAVKSAGVAADASGVNQFRFRLEPVLDVRRRREELLQGELAQAIRTFAAQQARVVAAEQTLEDGVAAMRTLAAGSADLRQLRAAHEEIERLRRELEHERDLAGRLESVAVDRREALVAASQDRESLASLRERAETEFNAEHRRVEQREMDELANRRARRGTPPSGAVA